MTFEWAPLSKDDVEAGAELMGVIDEVDQVGGRVDADDLVEELADPLLDPVEGTRCAPSARRGTTRPGWGWTPTVRPGLSVSTPARGSRSNAVRSSTRFRWSRR